MHFVSAQQSVCVCGTPGGMKMGMGIDCWPEEPEETRKLIVPTSGKDNKMGKLNDQTPHTRERGKTERKN